jgi:hypothetical protein
MLELDVCILQLCSIILSGQFISCRKYLIIENTHPSHPIFYFETPSLDVYQYHSFLLALILVYYLQVGSAQFCCIHPFLTCVEWFTSFIWNWNDSITSLNMYLLHWRNVGPVFCSQFQCLGTNGIVSLLVPSRALRQEFAKPFWSTLFLKLATILRAVTWTCAPMLLTDNTWFTSVYVFLGTQSENIIILYWCRWRDSCFPFCSVILILEKAFWCIWELQEAYSQLWHVHLQTFVN